MKRIKNLAHKSKVPTPQPPHRSKRPLRMTSCTEGGSPPAETGDLCSSSDKAKAFAAEHARSCLHLRPQALAADPLVHRGSDCALAPARARTKQPASSDHRLPVRAPRVWPVPLHPPTLGTSALCGLKLPAMPRLGREQHVVWQFRPNAMRTRAWCQLQAVRH